MTGASLGYSGYYNGVSLLAVGEYGYWWSSTIRNANSYSYLLRIGYDNIGPQYSLNKYVGRAVRCLPNPGPTYSLPMGMGIMRVGVEGLEAIRCHICTPAITTGMTWVNFTIKRQVVFIGHLIRLATQVVTA